MGGVGAQSQWLVVQDKVLGTMGAPEVLGRVLNSAEPRQVSFPSVVLK